MSLPVDEAHHIFKVLRGREGDTIEVVTQDRSLMLAELYGDARSAEAHILEEITTPEVKDTRITLYQAVPKAKHMDFVVEKATELGVERVVPLLTEYGEIVRPSEDKADRWRRLAGAAARQSLQLRIPEVCAPESFQGAVESLRNKGKSCVMLHNEAGLPALEDAISAEEHSLYLFVGPEGGWSEEEMDHASERGIKLAQMGPYRLRTETAGVVAVARADARVRHLAGLADENVWETG